MAAAASISGFDDETHYGHMGMIAGTVITRLIRSPLYLTLR